LMAYSNFKSLTYKCVKINEKNNLNFNYNYEL
jgi:hypothetical protein